MKKLLLTIGIVVAVLFGTTAITQGATSVFQVFQGGTGTSSPSGILYGDNSGSNPLKTVSIGAGCTFIGGTLSCPGTGSSASSTLLGDNNTFSGINSFTNTSSNFAGTLNGSSLATILASAFSTTSASYFLSLNQGNAFSTTSANYLLSTKGYLTSAVTSVGAVYPLSSTGGNTPVISSATSSASSAGVLSAADWTNFNNKVSSSSLAALYPFPLTGNATSTLTQFNGGLTAFASSTIGNGTLAGGLTISGDATTTGNIIELGAGTSTYVNGINISSGCFSIAGTCIGSSFASSTLLSDNNTFSGSNNFTKNVGIGTASPIATLQIASTSAGVTYPLWLTNANSNSEVQIRLQPSTAATRYNVISAINNGTNAIDTVFSTANGALPTERMRITAAGTVGIGTTSPATTLSVTGSGYFTGGGIGVGVLNTTSGTLQTVGNIIDGGTLTVNGATSTFANGINLTTGCYAIGGTCISAGGGTTYTGTYPIVVTGSVISTPLATTTIQQTYGTPQIGAITFATTSASFNGLTVADAISNSGGTFTITPLWSGTLNNAGLTNPSTTVNSQTCTLGSTCTITAASSTLLSDNNTWTGSNIFNNSLSIGVNTNGILLGGSTWIYSTSTNKDTILGIGAGGNSATTSPTDAENTSIGFQSQKVGTGTFNSSLGAFALANGTGSNNTAIGWEAMAFNTTGSANTGIGYFAIGQSTNAVNSTGIGYESIPASSAQLDTTAIGYKSGLLNTGWDSTFLGELSGQNVTTGNNNILIGYNALAPSATANNQLNIGNIIFGSGLAATSSSTTLIPTSTGSIGIGTSTPGSLLSVGNSSGTSGINFSLATSTFSNTGGINLTTGCYAINGTCTGNGSGTVTAVTATAPLFSTGGTTPNITWTGLATTTNLSSSNILVSNGGAGVYGVATSTLAASSPLTGSFTQIGSGGTLGCQTASGSQAGCLASADWTTFNNKQAAISLTTTGTGAATFVSNTLNIPTPVIPAAANPTGTVGLTAVNGSATTFLRSDGAPALSQSIIPTWTGLHTFQAGWLSTASSTVVGNFTVQGATTTLNSTLRVATSSPVAFQICDIFGTCTVTVNTASTTGSIFTVAATTSTNSLTNALFMVDQYGHLTASSTAKITVGACGTGGGVLGTNANDTAGDVTTGTGASSCALTFGAVYSATPIVIITDNSTGATVDVSARSTTGFTVALSTSLSTIDFSYLVVIP